MFNKEKLRELREKLGLSMAALAEKVGCNSSFISFLENGQKEPTGKTLYFLARALGCTMDELYKEN